MAGDSNKGLPPCFIVMLGYKAYTAALANSIHSMNRITPMMFMASVTQHSTRGSCGRATLSSRMNR